MLQEFSFLAGGRQVDAKGTWFRYEAGSAGGADESIVVRGDGTPFGTFLPGDAIRLPTVVKRWEIAPVNAACVGRVRVGVGSVDSARLVGTVQVVDTGRILTEAGLGWTAAMNYVAAAFTRIELQNPAASGKKVIVEQLIITAAVASQIVTGWTNIPGTVAASGSVGSKKTDGALASAALCYGVNSATSAGGITRFLATAQLAAGAQLVYPLKTPIVVTEGNALCVTATSAVATNLSAAFDYQEQPK